MAGCHAKHEPLLTLELADLSARINNEYDTAGKTPADAVFAFACTLVQRDPVAARALVTPEFLAASPAFNQKVKATPASYDVAFRQISYTVEGSKATAVVVRRNVAETFTLSKHTGRWLVSGFQGGDKKISALGAEPAPQKPN